MQNKRNTLSITHEEGEKLIEQTIQELTSKGIQLTHVSLKDLLAYFGDNAPSGDTTTVEDVLKSKWLLVHEIVEISELKQKGYSIDASLLWSHPSVVMDAHLYATRIELDLARQAGDSSWIKQRCKHVLSWVETTTDELQRQECLAILHEYCNEDDVNVT